ALGPPPPVRRQPAALSWPGGHPGRWVMGETAAAVPTAIVVMGVSGSGKTTVAALLAGRLGWTFADADDFHPPANVEKMHAGTPPGRPPRPLHAGQPNGEPVRHPRGAGPGRAPGHRLGRPAPARDRRRDRAGARAAGAAVGRPAHAAVARVTTVSSGKRSVQA